MACRSVLTHSPEELQTASDLVVVFTPQSHETVLKRYSDGNVQFGYTKTTGRVEEVLSGEVSAGDTIVITEECYLSGSVLWTQQGYLPTETGDSYLLFLRAYPETSKNYKGMYYPVDLEYGKYLLSSGGENRFAAAHSTGAQLQVGPDGDLDTYLAWYAFVQERYPEVFDQRA